MRIKADTEDLRISPELGFDARIPDDDYPTIQISQLTEDGTQVVIELSPREANELRIWLSMALEH